MERKAPLGTKILAVLVGLEGIAGLIAVILFTVGGLSTVLKNAGYDWHPSTLDFAIWGSLAIIYLVGAVLVFKTNQYGWWALVIWAAVQTIKRPINQLFYVYQGGPFREIYIFTALIGFIIMGLIFWYLFRSKTREAFGITLFSRNHSKAKHKA